VFDFSSVEAEWDCVSFTYWSEQVRFLYGRFYCKKGFCMNEDYETFVMCYEEWHEGNLNLQGMKTLILGEIGEERFHSALEEFRSRRLNRESSGEFRTLYDANLVVE
jgi:hypothetical protein